MGIKNFLIRAMDNLRPLLLRTVVTEEYENPFFHGLLAPSVRTTVHNWLRGHHPQSGELLEIGCGDGLFLKRCATAPTGLQVGVDILPSLLRSARPRLDPTRARLINGSAFCLPLRDRCFGSAVCINILNSIRKRSDRLAIFREAYRVVCPGGYFICDIRNRSNPLIRMRYGWYHEAHPESSLAQVSFTRAEIIAEVSAAGFTIAETVNEFRLPDCLAPALVMVFRKK